MNGYCPHLNKEKINIVNRVNFEVDESEFKSVFISSRLFLISRDFHIDNPKMIEKLKINTTNPILKKKLQMLNARH